MMRFVLLLATIAATGSTAIPLRSTSPVVWMGNSDDLEAVTADGSMSSDSGKDDEWNRRLLSHQGGKKGEGPPGKGKGGNGGKKGGSCGKGKGGKKGESCESPSPPPPSTSPPTCRWELPRQSACQNQGANQRDCTRYFYPKDGQYFQCRWAWWDREPKCIGQGPQCDPKSPDGTTRCNCRPTPSRTPPPPSPPVDCNNYQDHEKCKIRIKDCEKPKWKDKKKCEKKCRKESHRKEPRCQKTCCELGFAV
mmetsp:Transcript_21213/g.53987  ORF Transcript_21213/g.53987 Transcript_21213/m.53987 type:complete len:250 (+) Transcript_21213:3-752(+)